MAAPGRIGPSRGADGEPDPERDKGLTGSSRASAGGARCSTAGDAYPCFTTALAEAFRSQKQDDGARNHSVLGGTFTVYGGRTRVSAAITAVIVPFRGVFPGV